MNCIIRRGLSHRLHHPAIVYPSERGKDIWCAPNETAEEKSLFLSGGSASNTTTQWFVLGKQQGVCSVFIKVGLGEAIAATWCQALLLNKSCSFGVWVSNRSFLILLTLPSVISNPWLFCCCCSLLITWAYVHHEPFLWGALHKVKFELCRLVIAPIDCSRGTEAATPGFVKVHIVRSLQVFLTLLSHVGLYWQVTSNRWCMFGVTWQRGASACD